MSSIRLSSGCLLAIIVASGATAGGLAATWDGDDPQQTGALVRVSSDPPYEQNAPILEVAPDGVLRVQANTLLHLSRQEGVVTQVEPTRWQIEASFHLLPPLATPEGVTSDFRDLVFVAPDRVWLTRSDTSSLLELDLTTGDLRQAVDLAPLGAGPEGLAMESALVHQGRLYVQLRGSFGAPPGEHFLAIIDLATESLVDVDPETPGIQAIALLGTAPRFRMQIVPGREALLLSATGSFHDYGGLELIDLATLESQGVVIREFADVSGNDLGVFVMTGSDTGWLVFSTDIVLSSHLHAFTLSGGGNTPEVDNTLFYFAPALVLDEATQTLFWPEPGGLRAFDSKSGVPRAEPTPLDGDPTDLVLLPEPRALGLAAIVALLGLARATTRRPGAPSFARSSGGTRRRVGPRR